MKRAFLLLGLAAWMVTASPGSAAAQLGGILRGASKAKDAFDGVNITPEQERQIGAKISEGICPHARFRSSRSNPPVSLRSACLSADADRGNRQAIAHRTLPTLERVGSRQRTKPAEEHGATEHQLARG